MDGSPLDELLGGSAGPIGQPDDADQEVSPLEELTKKIRRDPTPALDEAITNTKPDEYAKNRALGKSVGLPIEAVEANPEAVQQRSDLNSALQDLIDAPLTGDFLSNPENAKLAHDDTKALVDLEHAWEPATMKAARARAAIGQGNDKTSLDIARVFVSGVTRLSQLPWQFSRQVNDLLYEATGLEIFGAGAEYAAKKSAQAGELADIVQGSDNSLPDIVKSVIESSAQSLATLPLAFVRPALAALGLAGVQGGQSYEEGRAAGLDPLAASKYGLEQGSIEFLGEKFGLEYLVRGVKIGMPVVNQFVQQFIVEQGQEQITTAWQDYVTWAEIDSNKGKTFGDYLDERPNRALETAVATAIGVGINTTAAQLAASSYGPDEKRAQQAIEDAKRMDAAHDAIERSALTQRAPDKMIEQSLAVMTANGVDRVWIDAQAFRDYVAGQATEQAGGDALGDAARTIGLDPGVVQQEVVNGGEIELTPEQFTRHILMSKDYEQLKYGVRLHQDAMTLAEAEDHKSSGLENALAAENAKASRDTTEQTDAQKEVQPALTLAEDELGLRSLIGNAKDAGLTDAQYEAHLEKWAKASEDVQNRQQRKAVDDALKTRTEEWKRERERVRQSVEESIKQTPVYAALDGLGRNRISRYSADIAFPEEIQYDKESGNNHFVTRDEQFASLPKRNGKSIIAPKSQKTDLVDADAHAQLYGYEDARQMFEDMRTAPDMKELVERHTDRLMAEEHKQLGSQIKALQQARESFHSDAVGEALTSDFNALRTARKEKRLKPKLIKLAAMKQMLTNKIKDITVEKYLAAERKNAREAGKLLRNHRGKSPGKDANGKAIPGPSVPGNRKAAVQAAYRRVINFYLAQQAYKVREQIRKQMKWLRQFDPTKNPRIEGLPHESLRAIQDILADYKIGPRMSDRKRGQLHAEAFSDAVQIGATTVEIPEAIRREDATKNYQDMTLEEWQQLYGVVRDIYTKGMNANKLLNQAARETVDHRARVIVQAVENLPKRPNVDETRLSIERAKRYGRELVTLLFNADTIVRELDGFKDLGPARLWLKGLYDRAFSHGYQPGQKGYIVRQKENAQKLIEIYSKYTDAERANMDVKLEIPGLNGRRLTRAGVLSVLLNSGNSGNIAALTEGGFDNDGNPRPAQFTTQELQAIHDFAQKTDWEVAQALWDHIETLRPEIEAAAIRRQGFAPDFVEAEPIQTRHGTFRGGYFPLRYDHDAVIVPSEQDLNAMLQNVRFGNFAMSHTRNGHLKDRVGSGGRRVKLDPFVLNSHLDQVLYDLEMGDAINDIFKVLHHKDVKNAFADAGHLEKWHALDLWLQDVVVGEVRKSGAIESIARWLRTGFTVQALALNFSVAALQPLGLIQSAVHLGKENMWHGIVAWAKNPVAAARFAAESDPAMAQRQDSYNKDIIDASRQLKSSILNKVPGGKTASKIADASFFYFIKKAQWMTDVITWTAARRDGMQKFGGNEDLATEHAYRAVVRAQGSGNFGDRSAVERGTTSKDSRQTEKIRMWTALSSYFITKMNVAYERTKKTNFRNPAQAIDWAADMALLYTVEALIAAIIHGATPDLDDDGWTWLKFLGKQSASTFAAGIPFVREGAGRFQGFQNSGGGVIGSTIGAAFDAYQQWDQLFKEGGFDANAIDRALFKKTNSLLGLLLHYPAAEINKMAELATRAKEGEDIDPIEFLFGPRFDK